MARPRRARPRGTGPDAPTRGAQASVWWLAAVPLVGVTAVGFVAGRSGLSPAVAVGATAPVENFTTTSTTGPIPSAFSVPLTPIGVPAPATTTTTRSTTTTTTTTVPPKPSTTTTTTRPAPAATAIQVGSPGWGCGPALAWLESHSAPGFRFECPGYSLGHQAMTCIDVSGICPGERLISIAVACPAAYMNEAHNSWVLTGLSAGRIDPYGYCP